MQNVIYYQQKKSFSSKSIVSYIFMLKLGKGISIKVTNKRYQNQYNNIIQNFLNSMERKQSYKQIIKSLFIHYMGSGSNLIIYLIYGYTTKNKGI